MIHTIYILSPQGSIIFDKHYQGISNRNLCDLFWKEYLEHKEKGGAPPVVKIGKHYVFHVERHKLFFLATAVDETSPLLVLEFLHRMVDLFEEYFTHINENNLKDNFVTVYQLLEEMMDGGFPFTTEPAILKDMIMLPTIVNRTVSALTGSSKVAETAPDGAFSNIPWRKSNIKYSNNEIYFDVVEEVDAIFDTNGTPVSSEINGEIICNCRLGGMPDIALSFANPDLLDDCSFHPCVRYSRFQQEKIVSFIPPDGQFKLLGYKAKSTEVKVPIYVKPTVSFSGTSGHIQIVVGSRLVGNPKPAEGVTVTIPLPKNTVNHSLVPTIGRIQFDEATKVTMPFLDAVHFIILSIIIIRKGRRK
eukprot:TRINITY_DN11243_c0_g1_i1.p1 TRINITY_DN11243_c0_g1~~TRINITY_DN11243_c0_g1_i1.p1  ORF type:complete len:361 (+),score=68.01 TRINITY_DN11243_c0_g1_i1:61-1143(+)